MTYLVMWKNWCHWNMSNKCKLCPLVWKVLWMPTPLLPPHHLLPTHIIASYPTSLSFSSPSCLPPHSLASHPTPFAATSITFASCQQTPAFHPTCLPPISNLLLLTTTPYLSPPSLSFHLHFFLSSPFFSQPLFLSSHFFSSHPTPLPLIPPPCLIPPTHFFISLICLSSHSFVSHSISFSHPACLPVTPTPPASYLNPPPLLLTPGLPPKSSVLVLHHL